jgi:WD40 repeat protein
MTSRLVFLVAVLLVAALSVAASNDRADYVTPSDREQKGVAFGPFTSVAFSPDGKTLAKFRSAKVTLWDVATGKQNGTFRYERPITSWAFSPDGKSLALGFTDDTVKCLDVATAKEKVELQSGVK